MIIRPDFYRGLADRSARRARTGWGSIRIGRPESSCSAARLEGDARHRAPARRHAAHLDLRPQCAAGRAARAAMAVAAPHLVLGFTAEIRHYMQLERFLHRQARPGQHQRGHPAGTAGDRGAQHLDHAAGALQHRLGAGNSGAGIVLDSFSSIRGGVAGDHRSARANFALALSKIRNRAVFEIPEILEASWKRHIGPPIIRSHGRDAARRAAVLN